MFIKFKQCTDGLGNDREGNWQVIFQVVHASNAAPMDYCRETMPGSLTRKEIQAWAETQCTVHDLAGAVIEKW